MDPDESVMGGAAFFLMESIDGFNASTGLPALHAGDAAIRHRMGRFVSMGWLDRPIALRCY